MAFLSALSFLLLSTLFESSTGTVIGASSHCLGGCLGGLILVVIGGGDQQYVDFVVKHTHGDGSSAAVTPATATISGRGEEKSSESTIASLIAMTSETISLFSRVQQASAV
jgi:hypothetical protein